MNTSPPGRPSTGHPFLAGGGEMAALIAAHDWAATPLGAIATWPAHLRTATALMLRSRVPMVMLWGEAGIMIYNDAYSGFAGLRHPALLGSRVREGWPEVAAFNDNVMKVGLAGGNLHFENQELTLHRNNRAEQVWMNLDYSPLPDAAGGIAGVLAVVIETTAQVQAVHHLSSERARMAQLFAQAPGFMAMLRGPTHVFELANPSYQRLVGQRALIGRTVAEALPDAAAQGYVQLLDRVYASGEAFVATGSLYSAQPQPGQPAVDSYVDFVFQPVRNAAGEVDGIFVEGVDVSDRVRAEQRRERLAALSDRFGAATTVGEVGHAAAEALGEVLDVSRVGYGSIDADADTLHVERDWCAPGVESLAGVTPLREYGSFIDSLKRNEFIAIRDVRQDGRTSGAAAALEARSARSFVNVPVLEQGRLVAVFFVNDAKVHDWSEEELAFIRDVGQRTRISAERVRSAAALRASEARLREANETLEAKVEARTRELMEMEAQYRQAQKMEAIGQLTGGIAHDFNNLLAAMSGSLQVMQRRQAQGLGDNERYLAIALNSVQRAAALTQRLLAFSRRQTLDPKAVDVDQLVTGLEDMLRRSVGPAVALQVQGAPGLWPVRVDVSQLENALLNLCINARDAMAPAGGKLRIATANQVLDAAEAAALDVEPGEYVRLSVADTGAGMTAEVIARAFDPFFTTKPLGQGTGLGLSMIYGFVRQSGGQVRIESAPGRGTTMHLLLPRHHGPSEQARPAGAADAVAAPADGEVILLIEDEASIRDVICEELEHAGYRVLPVADGQAGLRVLQSNTKIDLLLTDVGLPGGLNGRQVADAGRVSRPGLKVLFITGYAESSAVGNGLLEAGMEVLTKPFAIADLVAKVGGLVQREAA